MVCYNLDIWLARNQVVFQGEIVDCDKIIPHIKKLSWDSEQPNNI